VLLVTRGSALDMGQMMLAVTLGFLPSMWACMESNRVSSRYRWGVRGWDTGGARRLGLQASAGPIGKSLRDCGTFLKAVAEMEA